MALHEDPIAAHRLDLAAEHLELALLRPTTMSALLDAQRADFTLVEELIQEAAEQDPDFTELRVDPARFSPFFVGGPLGDLEANIEALNQARHQAGTLLVELGHAA
ncbi:hypothetical protein KALB_2625 [Kutzneria albida DSM 43870]|uniref:Uncharacterized protein n=2 Tax=Kutzneria TaxID=43356 RepID=W5W429_9PSEU|nr:hypothetical protein KALB_2625 [Kutzneria albida DSM 43870]